MALHWLVAVLIAVNVALVWTVDLMPEDWVRPFIDTHKSIGITVLGLALMRLLWRAAHPPPPFPRGYRPWERRAAHAAHGLLYALMLALPVSGWMHDSAWKAAPAHPMRLFWLLPWPRIGWIEDMADPAAKERLHELFFSVHASLALALYGLVALHVAGALKHQFLDRETELQRMLPGPRR